MAFRPVLALTQLSDVDLSAAIPGDTIVLGGGGLWLPAALPPAGMVPLDLPTPYIFDDVAFPPNANTIVAWTQSGTPDHALLDLSNPSQPAIVDTGLYTIAVRVEDASVNATTNLQAQLQVPIGDPMVGGYTVNIQEQSGYNVGTVELEPMTFWLRAGAILSLYLAISGSIVGTSHMQAQMELQRIA